MKKRSYVALIMAMVIMAVMLVACGEDQQQVATTTGTEPTQVVETPKSTEEPIQVPTSTPTPIPTEAPTPTPTEVPIPTELPNVVNGYDFSEYYNGERTFGELTEIAKSWNTESIRIIAMRWSDVSGVLQDGDSYEINEEHSGANTFYICVPKDVEKVSTGNDDLIVLEKIPIKSEKLPYYFYFVEDAIGENMEIQISAKYKDGTEEVITIYITRDNSKF